MMNGLSRCAVLVLFVAGATSACGGDSKGGSGRGGDGGGMGGSAALGGTGGAASGASGAAGSGRGGSGGQAQREPLLERPLNEAYDCKLTSAVAISAAPKAQGSVLGPASANGSFIAFTKDFAEPPAQRGLFVAVLGDDGSVTSPVRISEDLAARAPELVEQGERTTLLWVQSDSGAAGADAVWSAQLDAEATLVRPAASSLQPADGSYVNSIRAVKSGSETRVFVAISNGMTGRSKIVSAPLAADGSFASPLAPVVENDGPLALFDVTAFAGGYALGYGYYDGSDALGRYLALDASLNQRHAPQPVAMGWFGTWGNQMALLARGEQLLMAKVASQRSDDGLVASFIEFTVYDDAGNVVGETERLQAPVYDVENISPRFVTMGDDLGFLWSKGSVTYVCGGCTPDNALEYVVLDGTSLRPKSRVVEVASPDSAGGLTDGELLGEEQSYLLLTNVQYHTTSAMATGRLACSMK